MEEAKNQATQDKKFMRMAIDEAKKALVEEEVPIGAVVVCGDRVIARGHNLVEALCDATAHAEMQAITAAASTLGGKYLKGCTLYVTVEPCVMCAGALAWSQIDRVVYGAADPKRGYSRLQGQLFHPKTQVVGGVMAEECEQLMKDFFSKLR
jgi:tRNA(adenine34) deaminase